MINFSNEYINSKITVLEKLESSMKTQIEQTENIYFNILLI